MHSIRVEAPAKLNLFLHVTGKRDDGFHLLESLFVFTEFGDVLEVSSADTLSLESEGPFASQLPEDAVDNLVLKAVRLLDDEAGAKVHLHKHIPVGAGLGGGSSDAAALVRALEKLWNKKADMRALEKLGSDIPACYAAAAMYARGVGEQLMPAILPPPIYVVLVNPKKPLLTADVFKHFGTAYTEPREFPQQFSSFNTLIECLHTAHNDLQTPALSLMPEIARLLGALKASEGCAIARMSGSGATCFGLYDNEQKSLAAAASIGAAHPGWWCVATKLKGG